VPGPPHSCTAAIPIDAARVRAVRCAAVRCAAVSEPSATARTAWWACSRTQPEASKPSTPSAAGSNGDETSAECTDACDR
jgi:hypothetical protein